MEKCNLDGEKQKCVNFVLESRCTACVGATSSVVTRIFG